MPPQRGHFTSPLSKLGSERTLVLCLHPLIITVQTVVLLVDLPDEVGRHVSTLRLNEDYLRWQLCTHAPHTCTKCRHGYRPACRLL